MSEDKRTIHVMTTAQHRSDGVECRCGFFASFNEADDQNVVVEFASDADAYIGVVECRDCFDLDLPIEGGNVDA